MALFDFLTGGKQYRVTGAGGDDKVFKSQEAAQDYLRGRGHDTYTFRPLEGDEQRKLSTTRPRTTMSPRARPDGNRDRTSGLRDAMERFASGGLLGLFSGGPTPQPVYDYPGSRVADSAPMATYSAPQPVSDVTMPADTSSDPVSAPAGSDLTGGVLNERMIGLLGLDAIPGEQMTQTDLRGLANAGFYDTQNFAALPPRMSTGTPLTEALLPTNVELYGDPLGAEKTNVDEVFDRMRANPLFSQYSDEFLRRLAEQVE